MQSQQEKTGQNMWFLVSHTQCPSTRRVSLFHNSSSVLIFSVPHWSGLWCDRGVVQYSLESPLLSSFSQKCHIFLRLHPPPVCVVLQVHFSVHFASIEVNRSIFVSLEFGALTAFPFLADAPRRAARSCDRLPLDTIGFNNFCPCFVLENGASFTAPRRLCPDVLLGALRLGLERADSSRRFSISRHSVAWDSRDPSPPSPLHPIPNPSSVFILSSPNPTPSPQSRPHPDPSAPSSCAPRASPRPASGGRLLKRRGGADDGLRAGGAVLIHVIRQGVQVAADGDVIQLVVGVLQAAPGTSPGGVQALAQAVLAAGQAAAAARQSAALLQQPFHRLDAFVDRQQLM